MVGYMRAWKLNTLAHHRAVRSLPLTRYGNKQVCKWSSSLSVHQRVITHPFLSGQKNGGKNVQMCRKICGLGCVTRALVHAWFTQPSPRIFLYFCMYCSTDHCTAKEVLKKYSWNCREYPYCSWPLFHGSPKLYAKLHLFWLRFTTYLTVSFRALFTRYEQTLQVCTIIRQGVWSPVS